MTLKRTNTRRIVLALIWVTGITTILASSLKEEKVRTPPEAVTVEITLASLAARLKRDIDTRLTILDELTFSGSYRANKGDTLTLDRDSFTLDTTTAFNITVSATDPDELLDATADFSVTADLDVGIDHNPAEGQFEIVRNDDSMTTTTLVTVTGNGVDVVTGGGATTPLSWSDFEAREDDNDASLDLRMASAAYNAIERVTRAMLLAEAVIGDVEENKTMLESLGLNANPPLSLECDNNTMDGESVLFWRADPPGSGSGTIGAGDSFKAGFGNCLDAGTNRFLEGDIELSAYNPADNPALSDLGVDIFFDLFISETETSDLTTVPTETSPEIVGEMSLRYTEVADTP